MEKYQCPICMQLVIYPIIATDGILYCAPCIEELIQNKLQETLSDGYEEYEEYGIVKSPITRQPIYNGKYEVCILIKNEIEAYLKSLSKSQIKKGKLDKSRLVYWNIGNINKLLYYCEEGDAKSALQSIDTCLNINATNSNGETAFIIACKDIELQSVALKLLENSNLNYNHISNDRETAFILACLNKLQLVALKLLEKPDLNYNHVNSFGNTAFIHVCAESMDEIALELLEKPDLNYNQVNCNGNTAFIHVCAESMVEIALELLKKPDLNYNQINITGNTTAFMYCCYNKLERVALKLLKKPDLNIRHIDNSGISALVFAKDNELELEKIIIILEFLLDEE